MGVAEVFVRATVHAAPFVNWGQQHTAQISLAGRLLDDTGHINCVVMPFPCHRLLLGWLRSIGSEESAASSKKDREELSF